MSKTVINSDQAPAPIGPYNQAIAAGGMLFVSGQIALDPKTGALVNDDLETETKQVFANLRAILAEARLNTSHIVKTSIFLSDMNDFGAINELYSNFVQAPFPARETVEVSRLPKDVRIEISVIAQLV